MPFISCSLDQYNASQTQIEQLVFFSSTFLSPCGILDAFRPFRSPKTQKSQALDLRQHISLILRLHDNCLVGQIGSSRVFLFSYFEKAESNRVFKHNALPLRAIYFDVA